MANQPRKKDREVQLALLATRGDVKAAAAKLGISRQALHDRLSRKPHLRTGAEWPTDQATLDRICASAAVLDVALQQGEFWAARAQKSGTTQNTAA